MTAKFRLMLCTILGAALLAACAAPDRVSAPAASDGTEIGEDHQPVLPTPDLAEREILPLSTWSGYPQSPDEIVAFRQDPSEMVAATGAPQAVVVYSPMDKCIRCPAFRELFQMLETEYWGRIHFVYLPREGRANLQIYDHLHQRGFGDIETFLITPEGERVRSLQIPARLGNPNEPDELDFRYLFDSYLETGG